VTSPSRLLRIVSIDFLDVLLFCFIIRQHRRQISYFKLHVDHGRNEMRWRPGQEASLTPPCSNLRSFGTKCTVLKKVLVTLLGLFGVPIGIRRPGNWVPVAPLSLRIWCGRLKISLSKDAWPRVVHRCCRCTCNRSKLGLDMKLISG